MRVTYYLTTGLAGLGIWVSDLLVKTHVNTHFAHQGDSGICAAGEGFSCAEVAKSAYGEIMGLPIAAIGLAFYAVLLVAAALVRFAPQKLRGIHDALFGAALLSVGYSAFLSVISATVIGKWCPLCMALYGVNLGLFLVTGLGHPAGLKGAFSKLMKVPTTPAFFGLAGLMVMGIFGAQAVYAKQAEQAATLYRLKQTQLGQGPKVQVEFDQSLAQHGRGDADAPVQIVEFSDFECPHCQRFAQALHEAQAQLPGTFRYVFKQFPMDNACNPTVDRKFHEYACAAAYAAECAGQQGKFWQMHDKLFEKRAAFTAQLLSSYAQELGVQVDRFEACMQDPATKAKVVADIEEGKARQVKGTPIWFINGRQVMGGRPTATLIQIIKDAQAGKLPGD